MLLDVDGIRAGNSEAIDSLNRECLQCARIGASGVGAQMFVEDIAQELVIHVLTRFIHVYDATRDAGPYLIEVARRMGSGMRRKTWREETAGVSEDSHEDTLPHVADDADAVDVQIEQEEIDARAAAARAELLRRMAEKRAGGQKPAAPLFTETELASVEQAVSELLARMDSKKPLPRPARQTTPRAPAPRQEDEVPTWKLMREWCKKLGIDTEDDAWHVQLSEPLGVHRATLWRWRYGRTNPAPSVLQSLTAIVDALSEART